MLRAETPVSMSDLFPAPPTCASGLKVYLDSHIRLRAEARRACIDRHIREIGGFGVSTDSPPTQSELQVMIDDPVWIPDLEDETPRARGIWKREVRFATTVVLTCSPTLQVMGMITCDVRRRSRNSVYLLINASKVLAIYRGPISGTWQQFPVENSHTY
jgi:hypothetical protein